MSLFLVETGGRIDFNDASVDVTFEASSTGDTMTIPVILTDDAIYEAQEGLIARLSITGIQGVDIIQLAPSSLRDTALIRIDDDDRTLNS